MELLRGMPTSLEEDHAAAAAAAGGAAAAGAGAEGAATAGAATGLAYRAHKKEVLVDAIECLGGGDVEKPSSRPGADGVWSS